MIVCSHIRDLTKIHFIYHKKINKQGQLQKSTHKLRTVFLFANKSLLGNIMKENVLFK